jgi:dienelactone hydrolase
VVGGDTTIYGGSEVYGPIYAWGELVVGDDAFVGGNFTATGDGHFRNAVANEYLIAELGAFLGGVTQIDWADIDYLEAPVKVSGVSENAGIRLLGADATMNIDANAIRVSDGDGPVALHLNASGGAVRVHGDAAASSAFTIRNDGARVQAWSLLPPGVTDPKNLPTVHLIHGGPHASFGDSWHWRWCAQAWAAKGWLAVMVNFHGSTGWGQEYAKCIMGEWGRRPYDDIMRATDALVSRGWANPDRLAAAGGSYGGYLVSWIAANTDRFKCLVNHAGVSDLQAQYARDVTPGREKALGGEPWGDIEGLDRYSPMRHSKGFKTPMLVIHGPAQPGPSVPRLPRVPAG